LFVCVISSGLALGQSTSTYLDLHDFGGEVVNANGLKGPDGGKPTGGVAFDRFGNMFGTTSGGGQHGCGTVWEVTTSGVYRDLHDFGGTVINADGSSGPDGANPNAGVAFDRAGNMYGTAADGGPFEVVATNGNVSWTMGMVWEITASGEYRDLYDFFGPTAGPGSPTYDPNAGVTVDGNGNLYGTTLGGGGIVWEITASGTFLDLHDFGKTIVNANGMSGPDGIWPYGGVTVDKAGNLYGTAAQGSWSGAGMVWEITNAGKYLDLHDFGGEITSADGTNSLDGAYPQAGVTFDPAGNMYGTASSGGQNAKYSRNNSGGIVWEITASGTYRDLHDFGGTAMTTGQWPVDGYIPLSGVTFDSAGNMFGTASWGGGNLNTTLSELDFGMVWELTTSGTYRDLHDFGGTVKIANGTMGMDGYSPQSGVTLDSAGNIYGTAHCGGPTGLNGGMVWCLGPSLANISLSPSSIVGGGSSTATVILSSPAPVGGFVLPVSSSASFATAPGSVKVRAGAVSTTFSIGTTPVEATTSAAISVGSQATPLIVLSPRLESVGLNPNSVFGGVDSTGWVTLSGPAPKHPLVVALKSYSSSVLVPASVTVEPGRTTAKFPVRTDPVTTQTGVVILATLDAVPQVVTLTVNPAVLWSLTLSPASVKGGNSCTGKVTLSSPAPVGGFVVTFASSAASVTVPPTIKIPAGRTSATFSVKTTSVSAAVSATILASAGETTESSVLTVRV
jgi:uncharacterized repeat protein (TIGR03803 family)